MKRILITSDGHAGSMTGLTHPKYNSVAPPDGDPLLRKLWMLRRDSWAWFDKTIKRIGDVDVHINNGDAIEGKGERSGGTELLSADRNLQVDIAVAGLLHIRAKKRFMTFGTPYHTGVSEDFERQVCDKIGAEKIEAEGHYDVNGLQLSIKHFIGNSSSPVSSMTAMRGAQIKQVLWSLRDQQPRANLIVRSHIHRCYNIGEPGSNFQGWTTPALQCLGTKYGSRQCDGLPVDFGLLLIEVENEHEWAVTPYIAPMQMQASSVVEI